MNNGQYTPRICFVIHDLSRTGAPITVRELLSSAGVQERGRHTVWSFQNGPLDSDMRSVANVNVCNMPSEELMESLPSAYRTQLRIWSAIRLRHWRNLNLRKLLRLGKFDLVVLNGYATHPFLRWLPEKNCPVIMYTHEFGTWVDANVNTDSLSRIQHRVSGFLANSTLTRDDLSSRFGLKLQDILMAPPAVKVSRDRIPDRVDARAAIRKEFGLADDTYIVAACATVNFHKGPDLFLQLAQYMRKHYPGQPVAWVWVGRNPSKGVGQYVTSDVAKSELAGNVFFIGGRDDVFPYLAAADVLAMVSREEPFGRVVLEAAAVGTPTVCYDKACGAKDFVERDCGRVASYLDVEEMGDAIYELLMNEGERQRLGANAQRLFFEEYAADVTAPRLMRQLEHFAQTGAFETEPDHEHAT